MELWERQSGESTKAFAAFILYRDHGSERSYAKVAQELGKSLTLINRWGMRRHWQSRVRAYDDYLDECRRERKCEEQVEMVKRQIRDARKLQDLAMKAARNLEFQHITAMQIARLFETGSRIERVCRGEPPDEDHPTRIVVTIGSREEEDERLAQETTTHLINRWAVSELKQSGSE